jgi:hypothetical protein
VGQWPIVVTTAPVDADLGGTNPYAYPISIRRANNPVRALVFDEQPPLAVEFLVDDGPPVPMEEVAPSVWQGEWDCTGLEAGLHELAVYAVSYSGTDGHHTTVELAVTQCDDGQDNDGNGVTDYPDDGGCHGYSDDSESGWAPGDDDTGDDDTGEADDDNTGDDDVSDDGDDDASGGDDGQHERSTGGCRCAASGPPGGAFALLAALAVIRKIG